MVSSKNYQIINLVASGGTADLYKALQTSLERPVAIKKLHQHLTDDENFTRRFILEAKAAASLDHENIVKIIDFGVEDNSYLMVMEFIEGESLRDILDKRKSIPVDLALTIAHRVLLGLEHAHTKGIVHRDIKPGNIMLTKSGRVKITDFGLAKMTQMATQHTAADSILGTPMYMSPEQALGETVDYRSDLFSLGTMLYEMLTGHQPFQGANYMEVIQNIINRNAPHPSRFNVEIPPGVESIILKSMNKNRDARFETAGKFRKAIEKHLGIVRLKEAGDCLKNLLETEGETVVLPQTMLETTRSKRSRARLGTLLVMLAMSCGALGYSLAPDDTKATARHNAQTIIGSLVENARQALSGRQAASTSASHYEQGNLLSGLPEPHLPTAAASDSTVSVSTAVPAKDDTPPAALAVKPAPAGAADPAPVARRDTTAVQEQAAAQGQQGDKPASMAAQAAVKKGWLRIIAEPMAEIYVDGEYRSDTPPEVKIELPGGPHTIECRSPGHKPYREVLHITTGELSRRQILLEKLTARVRLTTIDGADVYIDGRLVGLTPLQDALELDVGRHQITVKKSGYNTWSNEIFLEVDQVLPLRITLSPIY